MSVTSVFLQVVSGDITKQPVGAIITAINSSGMWFGGIDNAIQRASGSIFHSQAASMVLVDGMVVATSGGPAGDGKFSNVVFIVDDLRQPLSDLVFEGLAKADQVGMKTVALPTIRTGIQAGVVEPTVEAALQAMVEGIRRFTTEGAESITEITIVVYNDRASEETLKRMLFGVEPKVS